MSDTHGRETDGPDDEPTELEQRILELYDENELTVFECETIAVNLDEDPDDVLPAIEALVHDGELRALPVMYERVRDD